MEFRTQEDGFEYQAQSIFEAMEQDYKDEQSDRQESGEDTQTFAEWLWKNTDELGRLFYERFDEWCGIEKSTENFNF
jgi:hypothetical protein